VVPAATEVWAVVVSGSFPLSCGPAPPAGQTAGPCPPPATTATVYLDRQTGVFILTEIRNGPRRSLRAAQLIRSAFD
jgi:hypothetical protein